MAKLNSETIESLMALIQVLDYQIDSSSNPVQMTAETVQQTAQALKFKQAKLLPGLKFLNDTWLDVEFDDKAIYHVFYNKNLNAVVASPFWDASAMAQILNELDPFLDPELN